MDAKSKVDFINSVGQGINNSGEKVCPSCGSVGVGKFCKKCGSPMEDLAVSEEEKIGEKICPKCGSVELGKFCTHCGSPMEENIAKSMSVSTQNGDSLPRTESAFEKTNVEKSVLQNHERSQTPFKVLERRPPLQNDNKNGVFTNFFDTKVIEEEKSVFAEGVPEWSLEPPSIAVRRRGSKL